MVRVAMVVIGTGDGDLFAYRALDGTLLWHQSLGHPMQGRGLTQSGELLYAASLDGWVLALDPRDGHLIWSQSCQSLIASAFSRSQPISVQEPLSMARIISSPTHLMVQMGAKLILAFAAHDGTVLWTYLSSGSELALHAIGDTMGYISERNAMARKEFVDQVALRQQDPLLARRAYVLFNTTALAVANGTECWTSFAPHAALIQDSHTPSLMEVQGKVYLIGNNLACLNALTGTTEWVMTIAYHTQERRPPIGALVIHDPYLCIDTGSYLGCYRRADGSLVWEHVAQGQGEMFERYDALVIQDHVVYAGKRQSQPDQFIIEGFDMASGNLICSSGQVNISFRPEIAYRMQGIDHQLFIPSDSGLYALDTRTMQLLWSVPRDMRYGAFCTFAI